MLLLPDSVPANRKHLMTAVFNSRWQQGTDSLQCLHSCQTQLVVQSIYTKKSHDNSMGLAIKDSFSLFCSLARLLSHLAVFFNPQSENVD